MELVEREGPELGLHLNYKKSEVCNNQIPRDSILSSLLGACIVDPKDATLLVSSIGDVSSVSTSSQEKIQMLEIMGDRLKRLFSQDVILLHHLLAIPKLLYSRRTSPCFLSPRLQDYDNLLVRSIVSSVVNIHFGDDPAWFQATLAPSEL